MTLYYQWDCPHHPSLSTESMTAASNPYNPGEFDNPMHGEYATGPVGAMANLTIIVIIICYPIPLANYAAESW